MSYTLLAHSNSGTQALVQHGTQQAAYLYTFEDSVFPGVDQYTLVGMEYTVNPIEWVTDYDTPKRFDTIDALKQFVTA